MINMINTSDLIAVSNDSRLTRGVVEILNSKLTDKEKCNFQMWLRLINYDKKIDKSEINH